MKKQKPSVILYIISAYLVAHGILYMLGYFIATRFFIWDSLWNFALGNVTLFQIHLAVPIILGVFYLIVAYGLLKQEHWARLGLLPLCAVAVFFEFPIGTMVSIIMIIYVLTPALSKYFTAKIRRTAYTAGGIAVVAIGVAGILFFSGMGALVSSTTSHAITGYTLSLAGVTPEDKIEDITQQIGVLDVMIELTDPNLDFAKEQQDILIADISPYINYVIDQFTLINAITANTDASNLLDIAAHEYVLRITPVQPAALLFPYSVEPMFTSTANVLSQLDVDALHSEGYTGEGITVAVIDTGMKESLFDGAVVGSYSVTDDQYSDVHGTMVASCVKTIAPGVSFLNINVFEVSIYGLSASAASIIKGFEYVRQWKEATGKPVIVSCSFGVSPSSIFDAGQISIVASTLARSGVPVIAAAGNSGSTAELPYQITSPSGGIYVLSVGAVDENGVLADFSSRGPYYNYVRKPDIAAPGVEVPVMTLSGQRITASGTSFACPFVSGVCALLYEDNSGLSPMQLYDSIKDAATDAGEQGYDYSYGFGIANAASSMNLNSHKVPETSYTFLFATFLIIGIIVLVYPSLNKRRLKKR